MLKQRPALSVQPAPSLALNSLLPYFSRGRVLGLPFRLICLCILCIPASSQPGSSWTAIRDKGTACFKLASLLPACSQHDVAYVFFGLPFGLICLRILCLPACPQPAASLQSRRLIFGLPFGPIGLHIFLPPTVLPACSKLEAVGICSGLLLGPIVYVFYVSQLAPSLLPAFSRGRFLWTVVRACKSCILCVPACSRFFPAFSCGHFLCTAVRIHRSAYFMPPSLLSACSRPRVLDAFSGLSFRFIF